MFLFGNSVIGFHGAKTINVSLILD